MFDFFLNILGLRGEKSNLAVWLQYHFMTCRKIWKIRLRWVDCFTLRLIYSRENISYLLAKKLNCRSYLYTGCPRRNVKYFERVFLTLNYTDITQNTHIKSWTVTEIMAREKCGHLAFPRTVRLQLYREPPLPVVIWLRAEPTLASFTAPELRPTR